MADDKNKNEEQVQKEIISTCDISINRIITELHFKAKTEAEKGDILVQNSAIEGTKPEDAKFYGAGQHIIAAIPKKAGSLDTNGITREQALEVLQTYVQWFSGPDIKLNKNQLVALEMNDINVADVASDKEKSEDIAASKKDAVAGEKYTNENTIYIPSFNQYLIKEDFILEDDPTKPGEDPDGPDQEDIDAQNAATDAAAETPDDAKADEKNNDASTDDSETAKGWFISFSLNIKGQKEHSFVDVLKKFGKDLLEGFGIASFDWRSGANGETKTIGDALDALDKVFGKLNPDELLTKYNDNFKKKFPQGEAQTQIFDTKTIKLHLKKQLTTKAKSALTTAELALCTRVDKRDKSYKLYNPQLIADTVNASISGLFKNFKNKITKNDVYLVNNYSDDKKDKEEKQYTGDKGEGAVAESIVTESLLVEDAKNKPSIDQVLSELQAFANTDLKEYSPEVSVATTSEIIDQLKKDGVDEQKWFTELTNSDAKYCFLIKTTENKEQDTKTVDNTTDKENTNNIVSEKIVQKNLFKLLFEKQIDANSTILERVQNIFRKLIEKFKDSANEPALKYTYIDNLKAHIADNVVNESMLNNTISLLHLLYEDIDINNIVLEASNVGIDVGINIIDKKGYKNLLANIDKMRQFIKDNYKTKKGQPKEESIRYKTLSLFDEFAKLTTDDEMKKFLEDNFKDGGKDTDDKPIRTAFIKALSIDGIPDKEPEKPIEITFIDKDPNGQNKNKEIGKITKEPGKEIELPEPPEHSGWKFKEWEPDPKSMTENGETFSTYEEEDGESPEDDEDIEITFFDPHDPENPSFDDADEIETVKKVEGEIVQMPQPLKHDGYEFDKWDPDPDSMNKSGKTIATYKKPEEAPEDDTVKTQSVFYVIPDENGILNTTEYSIEFITVDPIKPEDQSKWKTIGDKQIVDDPSKIKYPSSKPEDIDGHTFIGWSPSEEEIKKNGFDKYYNDDEFTKVDKDGNKSIVIKTIYSKDQFTIKIVNPDPEDPENTKEWKDVAKITVIQVGDKKYYKADELRALAKETKSKDEADKYNNIATNNEEAFKAVDNLKGYDNKPYKLLKDKPWEPSLEDAVANGPKNGEDEVIVKAQYENTVKMKHTELDFYIIPMKGLSYKTRSTSKEGK